MSVGQRAIDMMVEVGLEQMGLGADTIDVLASSAYRGAEILRGRDRDRIQAIVQLRRLNMPASGLYWVVNACSQLDVFEAVAGGAITAEEGAWFLAVRRTRLPWYVRLASWLFKRSVLLPSIATEPK